MKSCKSTILQKSIHQRFATSSSVGTKCWTKKLDSEKLVFARVNNDFWFYRYTYKICKIVYKTDAYKNIIYYITYCVRKFWKLLVSLNSLKQNKIKQNFVSKQNIHPCIIYSSMLYLSEIGYVSFLCNFPLLTLLL